MNKSITAITADIQRFICAKGKAPEAVYLGRTESAEIQRYAEYYPQSINLEKRPEIHGIPVFVVDSDSHFGLKAGR